ncbi:MAG TPA: FGGY-family carbohydrate kinase [Acidimicrobiales bacterium]|nr:FGGY-family carbohydrate kinase [Acidimicrobiales bacterium]
MSILVVDVGTSSVRAAIVRPDATVGDVARRPLPPIVPFEGLLEIDAAALATAVLDVAAEALARGGPVDAVGVTAQRASTIAWDAATGDPLGPGLGWQDLRTAGTCLELQGEGLRLSPNESATKAAWLLDTFDPDRRATTRIGTVDSWVVYTLTGGADGGVHVTDPSNAAVTGLLSGGRLEWRDEVLERLRIPRTALPTLVDSSGRVAPAAALPGAPPVCGIAGDQQASLIGQGCVRPGMAKATFGTGGMLDLCTGPGAPASTARSSAGCFPIVAWRRAGVTTWGVEALMLSAGSAVDWLVDDLGVLADAAESATVAATVADAGGLVFVPALSGLGTPHWDFGARGTLLGATRGAGRAQLVRAVLEGVAAAGADLVEAAEADAGVTIDALRVDGGMSANAVFVQALADACQRPVEVSPQLEATTLGAGYLAGMAVGTWRDEDDVAAAWRPARTVEPASTPDRDRWAGAVERARRWYPELTALEF